MRRIIYASRALHEFDDAELLDLLARARSTNQRYGVTGMLVYASRSFLQVLEGEDEFVEKVWDRIRIDDRHCDMRVLSDGPVQQRNFADWTMGFWHPQAEDLEEHVPGYRAADGYPFVSAELVAEGETAETLLTLYARRSA